MENKTIILWDFDGVILNSNELRDRGFSEVLKDFPKEEVDQLMSFHRKNGGLSRYVKFRYFFEDVRKKKISEEEIINWAAKFSVIMKQLLIKKELIIKDSLSYIKDNYKKKTMHIVSASDGNELRYICKELLLDQYFKSIHGSPTTKKENIKNLINKYNYNIKNLVLIGDSINDYNAAVENKISFFGYNNYILSDLGDKYITKFSL